MRKLDWLTRLQATCVDVQHKKRGRPRLREEESLREVSFGGEYGHAEAYASQTGLMPIVEPARPRSKSYRELRSQPDQFYTDQRPRTSDPSSGAYYLHGATRGPPTSSYVSDSIPTVFLTPDFRVAQHNFAFSEALALQYPVKGHALLDLVVPSEREKIHHLQNILKSEMLDAAHLPPINGHFDSSASIPYVEELNLSQATAGFHMRSEYLSFRLPGDLSRGFPISISLARGPGPFVVMTLVNSLAPSQPLPSPHGSSHTASPLSAHGVRSPGLDQYPMHGQHLNGTPRHYPSQYPVAVSKASADRALFSHSHGLSQYRQTSPPQPAALPYVHARTSSGGDIPRSTPSSHPENSHESLRHLQLPPIRTSGSDMGSAKPEHRRGSSGKGTPVRGSPQSGRKKKRRRVEIGDMLH